MVFRAEQTSKSIFLSLLLGSYFLLGLHIYVAWKIAYLGLQSYYEDLPVILAWVMGGFLFLVGIGIVNVFCATKGWPTLKFYRKYTFQTVNLLFPMLLMLGKLFRVDKRKIEASFVAVSNKMVQNTHLKVPPDRLLVVTPHCLQLATCPHKITRNPFNCKRCGGCDIAALVKLAEEIGFHFFVVTGGTLARQTVKELRPKAVLAIACERDLTSGIQDVYPLPAVGVMNIRPNGPCFNTHVDIDEFKAQLEAILDMSKKKE